MDDLMKHLAESAEKNLTLKGAKGKREDCNPVLKEIIKDRERAIRRDDVYEIQRLTKHLNKTS